MRASVRSLIAPKRIAASELIIVARTEAGRRPYQPRFDNSVSVRIQARSKPPKRSSLTTHPIGPCLALNLVLKVEVWSY